MQKNAESPLLNYGYPINIENDVIATCNPRLRPEGISDNIYTTNSYYLYINTAVEAEQKAARYEKADKDVAAQRKQAELDAPRVKAEKEEESAAGATYYACLVRNAKRLTQISDESAEVIVQASFPTCSDERQAVFDLYRSHNHTLNPETMDIVDGKLKPSLLLEVIKARAQRPAPSQPPSTKPELPT